MASSNLKQRKADKKRERGPAPPLPLARVKSIAQEDESIGRMAVGATCIIARCTDAFLADLTKAAAERASAAGKRDSEKYARHRPGTSRSSPQQVLPDDVRQAVSEEERFDFLRPILNDRRGGSGPLGAASGAKGKRKGDSNSGGGAAAAGRGGVRGSTHTKVKGSTGSAASAIGSTSDLVVSGGAMGPTAGSRGNLLALAGLDEEGQRRALLGGLGGTASGFGGDDEEDYDI
ncbi:unnamed protein product [Scytosiphon promiscuus]